MWGWKQNSTINNTVTVEQQQSESQSQESQQPNNGKMMMLISPGWSVFDGIETFPESPDSLMSEINLAISRLEFSRANSSLETGAQSSSTNKKKSTGANSVVAQYDARMADEAFKAGCSALAAGKLDEAFRSLKVSLSKCPPDKASAVAKLHSLISLTSQQLQRSAD